MSDSKKRFEQMLDYDLDAKNAASGAFGKLYEQQQSQYLQKQRNELLAKGGTLSAQTDSQMRQDFDKLWNQQSGALKARTMAAYDGESPEEAVKNVGGDMVNRAGDLLSGGVAGALLGGGDFTGGISHQLRHAALGAIMGIPFVGDFLAKTTAWIGSKVNAMFGKGESLSWTEAGEKVEREKIKERMGQHLGQYADPNKLADMVNRSGREFTEEEKKKYAAQAATETPPAPSAVSPPTVEELGAKARKTESGVGGTTGGDDMGKAAPTDVPAQAGAPAPNPQDVPAPNLGGR